MLTDHRLLSQCYLFTDCEQSSHYFLAGCSLFDSAPEAGRSFPVPIAGGVTGARNGGQCPVPVSGPDREGLPGVSTPVASRREGGKKHRPKGRFRLGPSGGRGLSVDQAPRRSAAPANSRFRFRRRAPRARPQSGPGCPVLLPFLPAVGFRSSRSFLASGLRGKREAPPLRCGPVGCCWGLPLFPCP